jgi:hypothetical protein
MGFAGSPTSNEPLTIDALADTVKAATVAEKVRTHRFTQLGTAKLLI